MNNFSQYNTTNTTMKQFIEQILNKTKVQENAIDKNIETQADLSATNTFTSNTAETLGNSKQYVKQVLNILYPLYGKSATTNISTQEEKASSIFNLFGISNQPSAEVETKIDIPSIELQLSADTDKDASASAINTEDDENSTYSPLKNILECISNPDKCQ